MNSQNLNSVTLSPLSKTNSTLIGNQSNMHAQQAAHIKPQPLDQMEKMNFQSSLSSRDNLHPHQHQQFQQQPHQFQQQQQFIHQQRQLKQQNQQAQHLINNDAFGQSQLTDMSSQVKCEPAELHNDVLLSQMPEQFQLSEMQNQFQTSADDHLRAAQHHTLLPSGPQDISTSLPQTSQQMQQTLHPHELIADNQNDFGCVPVGPQSESVLPGQWHPQSQDRSNRPGNISHEQHLQEDFRQRISGQDEAQRNNLPSEGTVIGQTVASRGTGDLPPAGTTVRKSANTNIEKQYRNQQKWLLFLRHARRCAAPEGKCQELNCITVQRLWKHLEKCLLPQCSFPKCHATKVLLHHHKRCVDPACPVCVPVKNFLLAYKARNRMTSDSALPNSVTGSSKSYDNGDTSGKMIPKTSPVIEASEDIQPSMKRMKIEQSPQPLVPDSHNAAVPVPSIGEPQLSQDIQHQVFQQTDVDLPIKSELGEVKLEVPVSSVPESFDELKKDTVIDSSNQVPEEPASYDDPAGLGDQENVKHEKEIEPAKQENVTQPVEPASGTKSGKPKIKGVSLTELFTPEQVRQHIIGLRQWIGQVCQEST